MPGVVSPNTVSFGNPAALIAPDVAAQQLQLARQQQLIDLLKQRALTPDEQQTVTGAGPTRVVPYSPIQGLAKMLTGYMAGSSQKDIDEKNLDLSHQYAQRMAQILGGGGGVDPSVAAPMSMAQGAQQQPPVAAPDGSLTNTGGLGPTVQNAQRMDTMTQGPGQVGPTGQGGNNNFDLAKLLRGSVVEQVGGTPAASAYWKQYEPTDLQRNDSYLGISQDQSRNAELAKRGKEGYIPPTRLGNAGYNDPQRGFIPLPAQAPPGFINIPDPTDPSGYKTVQVGNGTGAVGAAAAAKTGGEGSVLPYAGVDASGNPLPVTNRTAAATQGAQQQPPMAAPVQPPVGPAAPPAMPPGAGNPPAGAGIVAPQSPVDRMAILQQQLAKTQQGIADPTVNDADRARLQQDATDIQGEMARMSTTNGKPNGVAPGAIYAAPPLGATSNADAAQKSSAQTMQASYAKLQGSNSTAQNALDVIDKMQALAAKKNPVLTAGFLGTNQSAVNPDAAEYEKQRANLITQLAAQNGTNGTDAGRALTGEAVPDFGKPKSAIADGLGTLRNQTVVQQLKANLLTPVYQSGDSKKYTTLENQFDQHISPSMVPLLTMPAGAQRAAALKAAAQNPAMKARLNWAAENGLLK